MRTIKDSEFGITRSVAESALEYFRGQAGTAHPEQDYVSGSFSSNTLGEGLEIVELFVHRLGEGKPAQTVGDLGHRLGEPKSGVFLPEPAAKFRFLPCANAFFDRILISAQPQDLAIHLASQDGFSFRF